MAASKAIKGIYSIRREKSEKGNDYFQISGWKEDGTRVRLRADTETEAKSIKKTLEENDVIFRQARDAGNNVITEDKRCVWTSDIIITQARVTDCEEALRLFPKNEAGVPDPRYTVQGAVAYALALGYNPVLPNVTVNAVLDEYSKHVEWRSKLPIGHKQRLGALTKRNYLVYRKTVEDMFGTMQLSYLAAAGTVKKHLDASSLSIAGQQKIASYINVLMEWAKVDNSTPIGNNAVPAHPQYIANYTPHFPTSKEKKGKVKVMSLDEVQAQIDFAWEISMRCRTPRAARTILLIFCALRPSELDNPNFSVADNCRTANVPEGTKTGWRTVPIPPNAQIMLKVLKAEGLLMFHKESHTSNGLFRAKIGYHASDALMRNWWSKELRIDYKDTNVAEARKKFREKYPFRPEFGRNIPDKARHTGGTYFVVASQDVAATATFMGNSPQVVEDHYWGNIDPEHVPPFYRIIPKALQPKYDTSAIPMPYWFKIQHSDEARAEAEKVDASVAQLTDNLSAEASARAEERRQRLNNTNRKCREKRGHIWNAKNREAYANDPKRRERLQTSNRKSYERHKDQQNVKRRERYATDEQYREKCKQQDHESKLRRDKHSIEPPQSEQLSP